MYFLMYNKEMKTNIWKSFFFGMHLLFGIVSSSSFLVGLAFLQLCALGFPVSWWLVVHGALCCVYCIVVLMACVTVPLRQKQYEEEYEVLRVKIDDRLSTLSSSPMHDTRESLLDDDDTMSDIHMKKRHSNTDVASATFGMFYIVSLAVGTFLVITLDSYCTSVKIFTICYIVFSAIFIGIAAIRVCA